MLIAHSDACCKMDISMLFLVFMVFIFNICLINHTANILSLICIQGWGLGFLHVTIYFKLKNLSEMIINIQRHISNRLLLISTATVLASWSAIISCIYFVLAHWKNLGNIHQEPFKMFINFDLVFFRQYILKNK